MALILLVVFDQLMKNKLSQEIASFQNLWHGGFKTGYNDKRNQVGIEAYISKKIKNKCVLEIGCGGGQWSSFMYKYVKKLYCVDILTAEHNQFWEYVGSEKKDKIILYQIQNGGFILLWEYRFDLNKNIDFIDCKMGDINGNGKQEVIVVIYSQEFKNQIYILSYEKRKDFNDALLVRSAQNRCREAGITWFPLPYHKSLLGTFFDILRGIFKAIFIRFKHKIEIVHCRSYLPALIGLLLKSIFRTKYIFDMRGFWANEKIDAGVWKKESLLFKITKNLEKHFLLEADKVVSLTEAALKEIGRFPYLEDKTLNIEVIRVKPPSPE